MTKQLVHEVLAELFSASLIIPKLGQSRQRTILGGAFGSGQFSMCSVVIVQNSLHSVLYYVADGQTGAVCGLGTTKQNAISNARDVLHKVPATDLAAYFARYQAHQEEAEHERNRLHREFEASLSQSQRREKVASIPRRRKRIFEESGGKCHYCGDVLTLDGKWHIEHKMPKALGGDNRPTNLVASCVACNTKKRDTTDVEFMERLRSEASMASKPSHLEAKA